MRTVQAAVPRHLPAKPDPSTFRDTNSGRRSLPVHLGFTSGRHSYAMIGPRPAQQITKKAGFPRPLLSSSAWKRVSRHHRSGRARWGCGPCRRRDQSVACLSGSRAYRHSPQARWQRPGSGWQTRRGAGFSSEFSISSRAGLSGVDRQTCSTAKIFRLWTSIHTRRGNENGGFLLLRARSMVLLHSLALVRVPSSRG